MNAIVKDLKANLSAATADPKKDVKLDGLVKMPPAKQGKVLTEAEIKASGERDTTVTVKLSTPMKIREGVVPVPNNSNGGSESISDGSADSKGERFTLATKAAKGVKIETPEAAKVAPVVPAEVVVVKASPAGDK